MLDQPGIQPVNEPSHLGHGSDATYVVNSLIGVGVPAHPIGCTAAVRCRASKAPTTAQIKACQLFLHHDIAENATALVVPVGAEALRGCLAQSGISKKQGTPQHRQNRTFLPVYHPRTLFEDQRNLTDYTQSIRRIADLVEQRLVGTSKSEQLRSRYEVVTTIEDLREVCKILKATPRLAFDSEYEPLFVWDPRYFVLGVSFSWASQTGIFIPIDHPESPFRDNPEAKQLVVEVLESVPLIVHHAEVDIRAGIALGANFWNMRVEFETLLASAAVLGPEASHKLKQLAVTYADTAGYEDELDQFKADSLRAREIRSRIHEKGKKAPLPLDLDWANAFFQQWNDNVYDEDTGYSTIPLKILSNPYACADTDTTFQVYEHLKRQLEDRQQLEWYTRMYVNSWRVNYWMHHHGIAINLDALTERLTHFTTKVKNVYTELTAASPEIREFKETIEAQDKVFTLGSRPQMISLLFTVFGMPEPLDDFDRPMRTKKDDVAMSKAALQYLADTHLGHPGQVLVRALLDHSTNKKSASTLEGFRSRIHTDGRIHPSFTSISRSGRRRSFNPNVQNLTAGKPDYPLSNMRPILTAGPGRVFISPDWGQLEFRLAACQSLDPNMLDCCRADDPHMLAATALDIPRKAAKTANFAQLYGGSAARLRATVYQATGILWTMPKAEEIVQGTHKLYKTMFDYAEQEVPEKVRQGFVISVLGNRRDFPHIESNNPKVVGRAYREGWNHLIQSVGHDMLSFVMDALLDVIHQMGVDWRFESELHDQFLLNVPEEEAQEATQLAYRYMTEIPINLLKGWLQVPLPAEVSVGPNYGELQLANFTVKT